MKRLLFLGLFFSQVGFADMTCPPYLPADICQFETQVYTATDFTNTDELRQVMIRLKTLLIAHSKDSAMIQDHILTVGDQIIEEAYNKRAPKSILSLMDGKKRLTDMLKILRPWEAKHGQIVPLDWHLPHGFIIGTSSLERSYDVATGRVRYGISYFATLENPIELEQFQLSSVSGTVIIDKAAGIGDWNSSNLQSHNDPFLSTNSPWLDVPFQDGLYLLVIKVKGENAVNGWFYLHGTSATSPVVLSPQVNEKLHTPTPTFSFQDFRSNAIVETDHRKRAMQVFHEGDNQSAWRTQVINPAPDTTVTLGQDANQVGQSQLLQGSYRLNLVFEERTFFGDMMIGRLSNTTVPFAIAK